MVVYLKKLATIAQNWTVFKTTESNKIDCSLVRKFCQYFLRNVDNDPTKT